MMASKIVAVIKLMSDAFDLEDPCEVKQAVFSIAYDHREAILETVKCIETKLDNCPSPSGWVASDAIMWQNVINWLKEKGYGTDTAT